MAAPSSTSEFRLILICRYLVYVYRLHTCQWGVSSSRCCLEYVYILRCLVLFTIPHSVLNLLNSIYSCILYIFSVLMTYLSTYIKHNIRYQVSRYRVGTWNILTWVIFSTSLASDLQNFLSFQYYHNKWTTFVGGMKAWDRLCIY